MYSLALWVVSYRSESVARYSKAHPLYIHKCGTPRPEYHEYGGSTAQLTRKDRVTEFRCTDLSKFSETSSNGFPQAISSQHCYVSGGCRSAEPACVRQPISTIADQVGKALLVIWNELSRLKACITRSTGATSEYSLRGVSFFSVKYQLATNSSFSSMHCTFRSSSSTTLQPNALSRYLLFLQQENTSCLTTETLAFPSRLFGHTPSFLIDHIFLVPTSTRYLLLHVGSCPPLGPWLSFSSSIQTLITGASAPSFYLPISSGAGILDLDLLDILSWQISGDDVTRLSLKEQLRVPRSFPHRSAQLPALIHLIGKYRLTRLSSNTFLLAHTNSAFADLGRYLILGTKVG